MSDSDFFVVKLLVRIHFIIKMTWWTGLAPWELEFPFTGSLISTITRKVRHVPTQSCIHLAVTEGLALSTRGVAMNVFDHECV